MSRIDGVQSNAANGKMNRRAFTLIELLIVVAIIALLVSIMLPSLGSAKELARGTTCLTSVRLLQFANECYADDNAESYAPGAANFLENRNRWFGSRSSGTGPFVAEDGPLSDYLPDREVRTCPSFAEYLTGFEAGCGGYGYNNSFVGQQRDKPGYALASDLSGNLRARFAKPAETIAFTDAAMVMGGLIEYSFCESPQWPVYGTDTRPSIHFRHASRTNVVWLDGRVTSETLDFSNEVLTGQYGYDGSPIAYNVGWFGPNTNELFDCE